jgi:uncharacterized repeat protein (TIGR01451 family)
MDRIGRILVFAGLAILLCAPAIVLAQNGPSLWPMPCADGPPEIDGVVGDLEFDSNNGEPDASQYWDWDWDEEWDDAHWEVIGTPPIGGLDSTVLLATQNDAENLYVALVEIWPELPELWDLDVQQIGPCEDIHGSLFWMGFEDDDPEGEWNASDPTHLPDEGWFFFPGFGCVEDVVYADAGPSNNFDFVEGFSLPIYVGRLGGECDDPFDCTAGIFFDQDTNTESAFAFNHYVGYQGDEMQAWVFVHEVAINLRNSPLNLEPEECYGGFFAALAYGPELPYAYVDSTDTQAAEEDVRALIDVIMNGNIEQLAIGWWPNAWYEGPSSDATGADLEDDFLYCCFVDGVFDPDECDWCLPCYGEVCLCERDLDLEITKTADPTVVEPGDDVQFTIHITGSGPRDAFPDCLRIVDQLTGPAEFGTASAVEMTSPGEIVALGSNELTIQIDLPPDGSEPFELYVEIVVTAQVTGPGSIENVAVLSECEGPVLGRAEVTVISVAPSEERPQKPSFCTEMDPIEEVIDGIVGEWVDGEIVPDESWQFAHWEDITALMLYDLQDEEYPPLPDGVHLGLMNDDEYLYLALVEHWYPGIINGEAGADQIELPPHGSIFWVGFEDDDPAGVWNATSPTHLADEGWFFFLGSPEGLMLTQDDLFEPGMDFEAYVERIGGPGHEEPCIDDCLGGIVFGQDTSTVHRFAHASFYEDEFDAGAEQLGDWVVVYVHEIAIDLENSPLNLEPGECFRDFFVGLGHAPEPPAPDVASLAEDEEAFQNLVKGIVIDIDQLAFGYWPNTFENGDGWDLIDCCFFNDREASLQWGPGEEFCDWCLPCFGESCLDPCNVNLEVIKSADRAEVSPGEEMEFTIEVTNLGPSIAKQVVIGDVLDSRLEILDVVASKGDETVDGQEVTVEIDQLDVDETVTITVIVKVLDLGTIENLASVSVGVPATEQDSNVVVVESDIEFEIIKTADPMLLVPGADKVVFTIEFTNLGPGVAYDVWVTDEFDARLQIVDAEATKGTVSIAGQVVAVHVDELAVDETVILTIEARVLQPGIIENLAVLEFPIIELFVESNLVILNAVELVPEPGALLLVGSGLLGLAGYAGLRLRKK